MSHVFHLCPDQSLGHYTDLAEIAHYMGTQNLECPRFDADFGGILHITFDDENSAFAFKMRFNPMSEQAYEAFNAERQAKFKEMERNVVAKWERVDAMGPIRKWFHFKLMFARHGIIGWLLKL